MCTYSCQCADKFCNGATSSRFVLTTLWSQTVLMLCPGSRPGHGSAMSLMTKMLSQGSVKLTTSGCWSAGNPACSCKATSLPRESSQRKLQKFHISPPLSSVIMCKTLAYTAKDSWAPFLWWSLIGCWMREESADQESAAGTHQLWSAMLWKMSTEIAWWMELYSRMRLSAGGSTMVVLLLMAPVQYGGGTKWKLTENICERNK